jgi:hypothetical protein
MASSKIPCKVPWCVALADPDRALRTYTVEADKRVIIAGQEIARTALCSVHQGDPNYLPAPTDDDIFA